MFGKRRRERDAAREAAWLQWRRHNLLHRLHDRDPDQMVLFESEVALSLRRDGYLTEDTYMGNWKLTPRGLRVLREWGADGPGMFRFPQ